MKRMASGAACCSMRLRIESSAIVGLSPRSTRAPQQRAIDPATSGRVGASTSSSARRRSTASAVHVRDDLTGGWIRRGPKTGREGGTMATSQRTGGRDESDANPGRTTQTRDRDDLTRLGNTPGGGSSGAAEGGAGGGGVTGG